ncbi:MAG: hypothetical protein IJ809_04895 [Clostridia bacterium]|nr:hypothetical protein [Clostridia bacterium]
MTEDELIFELANLIVSKDLSIVKVKDKLSKECDKLNFKNENDYFVHMYNQLKKYGFDGGYQRARKSIYVLEELSGGVDSVEAFIAKLSKKTGSTENVISQNIFDSRFCIYSALKFAMLKYINENKAKHDFNWAKCDEKSKLELYIELERFLYNL